jgi:hypothetical protein
MYLHAKEEMIQCQPKVMHRFVMYGECSRVLLCFSQIQRELDEMWFETDLDLRLTTREGVTFLRFAFEESWSNRMSDRDALMDAYPDVGFAIATLYEDEGFRTVVSHKTQGGKLLCGLVDSTCAEKGDGENISAHIKASEMLSFYLQRDKLLTSAFAMLGYYEHELNLEPPYAYE